MEKRKCGRCGVECFHNKMKKEGEFRCTFCGFPPNGNTVSAKYAHCQDVIKSQAARAWLYNKR